MRRHNGMRPQDVVILTKMALSNNKRWTIAQLSEQLGIANSEINESLNRSKQAGLLDDSKKFVKRSKLVEFLQHGVGYVFPISLNINQKQLGIPTALSVKPLSDKIISNDKFVWPDPDGHTFGLAIEPLFHSVPQAARIDHKLYSALALIDTLRLETSRIRERKLAQEYIDKFILHPSQIEEEEYELAL